jgi:hypothetical protein
MDPPSLFEESLGRAAGFGAATCAARCFWALVVRRTLLEVTTEV